MASKSAAKPHLARGSGGLQGEINDLRLDTDEALETMEGQVAAKSQSQANIRLNTNPTAGDTLTIGSNVYEFVATLGTQTAGRIGVLIGGTAAASLANAISAINRANPATPPVYDVGSSGAAVNVTASTYNTDFLHVEPSKFPGGPTVPGPGPSVALADTLTAAVGWDHANLNELGYEGALKRTVVRVVVTAGNLTTDFDVKVGFTPHKASVFLVTDAAGVPDGTGKTAVLTLQQARQAVTIDLDGGVTDPVATDIVYILVEGV
jgi:hypothetical protein